MFTLPTLREPFLPQFVRRGILEHEPRNLGGFQGDSGQFSKVQAEGQDRRGARAACFAHWVSLFLAPKQQQEGGSILPTPRAQPNSAKRNTDGDTRMHAQNCGRKIAPCAAASSSGGGVKSGTHSRSNVESFPLHQELHL